MKVPPQLVSVWTALKPFLSHAVTAGFTAVLTSFFTLRHFRKQKRHEFLQRRLDELYGPLLGLIKQVGANAKARLKVGTATDNAWRDICERHRKPFHDHEKYFEPFKRQIEYEDERFRKEDLPAFDEMLYLLRTRNHLAYPSTLTWFDQLTQYVDHLHRPIPAEALMKLGISGEPLLEFSAEVESRCDELKRQLSGDKSRNR